MTFFLSWTATTLTIYTEFRHDMLSKTQIILFIDNWWALTSVVELFQISFQFIAFWRPGLKYTQRLKPSDDNAYVMHAQAIKCPSWQIHCLSIRITLSDVTVFTTMSITDNWGQVYKHLNIYSSLLNFKQLPTSPTNIILWYVTQSCTDVFTRECFG